MSHIQGTFDQSRVALKYLDFICPREGIERHSQKFDLAGFVSLKQTVTIVDGYQYIDKNGTLRGSFSDILYWLAQELHHIASKVRQLRFSKQHKGKLAPFYTHEDGSVEHKFWRLTPSFTFRDYQLVKLVYDQDYQKALDHYVEHFASSRFMSNNKPYPPGKAPKDFEAWVEKQVEFALKNQAYRNSLFRFARQINFVNKLTAGQDEHEENMFDTNNWEAITTKAWKEGKLVAATSTRYDLLNDDEKSQHLRMMLIESSREVRHKNRKTAKLAASSTTSTEWKEKKLDQLTADDIPQRPIMTLPELPPESASATASNTAKTTIGLSNFAPSKKRSCHQMDIDDDDDDEESGIRPTKRARANLQLGMQLPLRPVSHKK